MGYEIKDDYDAILIQNLALVQLLYTLHKSNFVNSEYYDKLKFDGFNLKNVLSEVGINNSSTLILMLFLLLMNVKELQAKEADLDLETINAFIRSNIISLSCDSETFNFKVDFAKFIRNSIAHYNTTFKQIDGKTEVFFRSRISVSVQRKNTSRNITISLMSDKVGELIDLLFNQINIYLYNKYTINY